jgi:adenine-specific DNA-methyltransferase
MTRPRQLPANLCSRAGAIASGAGCTGGAPRASRSCQAHTADSTCVTTVLDFQPDTAVLRKARGAFFTPTPIAEYVATWAVRSLEDTVLEPSCGEAAFLLAAADRRAKLAAADGTPMNTAKLFGVELHAVSAATARGLLAATGDAAEVVSGDFFEFSREGTFDAVVGNPPYVRYQDFAGATRAASRAAALRGGVPLTGLASSWAAFTVHAAMQLKTGGRLGLVLPAELLTVNYASEIRRFLMERFATVDVVLFTERVFPEVLEEVVLLLADGHREGPADHISFYQARNADDLADLSVAREWTPKHPNERWASALIPPAALSTYAGVLADGAYSALDVWGDTTLGMVTGNNKYFALSTARVRQLGLAQSDVIRLSPPGSRHLRGLSFSTAALNALERSGSAVWLFRPPREPSRAARAYIAAGETAGVDRAYKCMVRTPWWRVPLVRPADLLLTYMNADTARITTNSATAHHLNSVHGVYLRPDMRAIGRSLLPIASLTTLTLLGAEVVGRAYGGGMLKLEPREADVLPVPSPAVVAAAAKPLAAVRGDVRRRLRAGRLADAALLVDDVILIGELGIARSEVAALREARRHLTIRRAERGKAVARVEG